MTVNTAFGYPLTFRSVASLPAPDGSIRIDGAGGSAQEPYRSQVVVNLNSVPDGAAYLWVCCVDDAWTAVLEGGRPWSRVVLAEQGETVVGTLPDVDADTLRHLRMAFRTATGSQGAYSSFVDLVQEIEKETTLEYTAAPALVIGSAGVISSGTVGADEGSFIGDSDMTATLTLWSTESDTDDPATDGTQISGFTFGSTPLTDPQIGLWLWVRGEITDGTTTLYAWSTIPAQVLAKPPAAEIVLSQGDIELIDTLETATDGLWQAVIKINQAKVDPGNANIRIRASWTKADAVRVNAISAWHPIIGGDESGFSPLLTALGSGYTKANGYWRVDRQADQEAAGQKWENPWALKEGRPEDNVPPRRGLWLWQVSRDAGVTWDSYSADSLFLVPDAPEIVVDPPVQTDEHWRSLEVGAAHTGGRYGYGIQYTRSQMGCEDNPNYIIAGGDMNGIRLSETGGTTWYHPASLGLNCFAHNSVAIDPRDHNYLLALSNQAWLTGAGTTTKWDAACGIYRSTDFGKTWSFVQKVDNGSNDQWNQSNFAYDPATLSSGAGSRTWWLANRKRLKKPGDAEATAIEVWKSTDGGASWSLVWNSSSVSTYGKIYMLRAHPTDGTLLMATSTGLWRSNKASISWSRVSGLPANRISGFSISPNGQKIYAAVRDGTNGLHYSSDNGSSWTKNTNLTGTVRRVSVNWFSGNTNEVVFVACSTKVAIATGPGAGGTWTTATKTDDPGRPGGEIATDSSEGFDGLICTTQADTALVNTSGRMYLCTDKKDFVNSSWGYTGANAATAGTLLSVHPTDKAKWAVGIQDNAAIYTSDGGQHFKVLTAPDRKGDGPNSILSQTGYSLATWSILSLCLASTGRLLCGAGELSAQKQVMAWPNDLTTANTAWTANANFAQRVLSLWRHPTSGDVICANDMVTKDRGATVAYGVNGRCDGLDSTGAGYFTRLNVESPDANKNVYRSTNWHSVSSSASVTYTEFYSSSVNVAKPGLSKMALISISPCTDRLLWIEAPNGNLLRVTNTGTTFASAVTREIDLKSAAGVPPSALFEIADICADAKDPEMCYVTIMGSGYAATVLRVRAGATGSISIENITYNAPKWGGGLSVNVLPHTGDVIIGGGVGIWMLPAPAGYQAKWSADPSVWTGLPAPIGPGGTTPPPTVNLAVADLPAQSTPQGTAKTVNISGYITGASGALTLSIAPTGQGVTISSAGVVTIASNAPVQSRNFTVTVTDSDETVTKPISVTVTAVSSGVTTVTSSAALLTAAKNASANAIIELTSGSYADIDLSGLSKNNLTIRSQNWAGASSGWAHFNGTSNAGEAIKLAGSSGINFSHIRITGAKHQNRDLFSASTSTNCSLRRSIITGGGCQIPARKTRNFKLEYNTLKDCYVDYVRAYEDCDGLEIRRNDFQPHSTVWGHGLHVDFIQFACNQTNTTTNRGTWGCVIEDNRFVETAAKGPADDDVIQGILVLHESIFGRAGGGGASDMPSKAHKDFVIRRNWIEGMTATNGIGLSGVDGATVASNKLLGNGRFQLYGKMAKCRNITATNTVAEYAIRLVEKLQSQNSTLAEGTSSIAAATVTSNPATLPTGWLGLDVGHLATDPQPAG